MLQAKRQLRGERMTQTMRRLCLACALVGASQLMTMPTAMAEILNLKCVNVPHPVTWLVYWIDFGRGTITFGGASASGVAPGATTTRVTITPEAFNFQSSMGPVSINRVTGVSVWPMQTPYQCTKGTLPPPAKPATKF